MQALFVFLAVIAQATAVNFVAVGDWGGIDEAPFYTEAQLAAATGMNKIANEINADFMLAVGDNFYHDGVTARESARFRDTFENVYSGDALQKDWFVIAGNHDHLGNVSAQIEYSADSARWKFPSMFYTKSFASADGTTVDMIFIDTVELSALNTAKEGSERFFDPLPRLLRSHASGHWDWIESEMKKSTADHLIVVGHYPVYSICLHGPTQTLIDILRPMLIKHSAHYLSGHDHCMEHFADSEGNVNYWLTGMGMECCYRAVRQNSAPDGFLKWHIANDNAGAAKAGFTSFQIDKAGLVATFHDETGNVLYTAPKVAARGK